MTRLATLTLFLAPILSLTLAGCGRNEPVVDGSSQDGLSTDALLGRAVELSQADRLDEATRLLEEHVARHPGDDRAILALAEAHQMRDEFPAAVRVLRAALKERPAAGALAVELATIYVSVDQPGMAEQTLQAARKAGAGDGDDLAYRLGVCLAQLGRFEEARAEFERAEAAGTDKVSVGYSLAMLWVRDGRWLEALERLEALHQLDPSRLDVVRELGRTRLALRPTDREVALQVIGDVDRVLQEKPQDWFSFEILGDAYMVLEDYEAAIYHYTEALRFGENPPRVEDRYRAAVLAQREADKEAGIERPPAPEPEWEEPPLPASLDHMDGFWRRQKGQ